MASSMRSKIDDTSPSKRAAMWKACPRAIMLSSFFRAEFRARRTFLASRPKPSEDRAPLLKKSSDTLLVPTMFESSFSLTPSGSWKSHLRTPAAFPMWKRVSLSSTIFDSRKEQILSELAISWSPSTAKPRSAWSRALRSSLFKPAWRMPFNRV